MWQGALEILALLVVANGAPIIAARMMRSVAAQPIDLGRSLSDGHPLFGTSKTWRGVIAALLSCAMCAPLLGFTPAFGLFFAALSMTGDLCASFVKRRRGLAPSDQALGLDQLPEALLPSLYAVAVTEIPWWWVLLLPALFMLLELLVSRPLYLLKIRKRPY
jgi:CDP-2,3-bis-(O-geranylgeranyl)-sn-glycerol synthase